MTLLTIRIEGGLLSPDFLESIHDQPGQKPADFGLDARRSLVDEVTAVWSDVRAYWEAFERRRARAKDGESLTSATREAWIIPLLEALGYRLTFQRRAAEVDGRTYALSHRAGTAPADGGDDEKGTPVHIVAFDQKLGERPPAGRGTMSPHALVQDYLNRSDDLWGIVTNGATLRLLRDSVYFSRPSYIEFDLQGMLDGERLDEFILFYRLAHRSRMAAAGEDGGRCLLENYHQAAVEQGGRIRDGLRKAVEGAILTLANGFLSHPKNGDLRRAISNSDLSASGYYQQLLYLIYRLLFLMVAEERNLLVLADPAGNEGLGGGTPPLQGRGDYYLDHYSITRLRRLAEAPLSGPQRFDDLYLSLRTLFQVLRDENQAPALGIPALNGELFDVSRARHLEAAYLNNRDLLSAIRQLSYFTPETGTGAAAGELRGAGCGGAGQRLREPARRVPGHLVASRRASAVRLRPGYRAQDHRLVLHGARAGEGNAGLGAGSGDRRAAEGRGRKPASIGARLPRCAKPRSRRCWRFGSAIAPAGPATSCWHPRGGSAGRWPRSPRARTSRPRRRCATGRARPSSTASTAWTRTRWPWTCARWRCGSRGTRPASR